MRVWLASCSTATLLIVLAGLSTPLGARADSSYHYFNSSQLDLTTLLPPPPETGSSLERSDQQQVSSTVADRTQAQLLEAQQNSMRDVFFFSKSIGPGFGPANLPITNRFFSYVRSDVEHLIDQAKLHWERARPNGAMKARGSYPSGHAAFAAATSILLSQLIPSKRDMIFEQARIFAENRIILGVHYPSDVAAGWTAGTLAAYVMMRDPRCQHDLLGVRMELSRAGFE